jgi:large subunit ribosomal protein L4
MKISVYDQLGASKGTKTLHDSVWAVPFKSELVHQVIVSQQSNNRLGTAHTKDRSEVSGTGKKPWRQKGTGRARHGSRRSPIWAGGGVAHGPRNEKNWDKKINRKMKIRSLASVLSKKLEDVQVVFVDKLSFEEGKTKLAESFFTSLEKIKGFETLNTKTNKNNILLTVPVATEEIKRACKNLPHVAVTEARTLNTLEAAKARYIVVVEPEATTDVLLARLEGKTVTEADAS